MELDSYDSPATEALLHAGDERLEAQLRERREQVIAGVGAVAFLLTAGSIAALWPWNHSLSPTRLALVLVVWVLVERVRFPVAGGWSRPTLVAFTPALFLLPLPIVPLVAMVGVLARKLPEIARGQVRPRMMAAFVSDAWFAVGPTLVLLAAGAHRFAWADWPVYFAAFAAQVAFDLCATIGWSWAAEGIRPRVQLPLLMWVYAVDGALAPLGLMVAAVSVKEPGLLLLTLPIVGMFVLFARERQQRLEAILELSTAYRGTTLLLCDMVEADDHYTGMHSRDVVDLSLAVADALALDPTARRNVEFSALLHDVGKVRVPKEIINKPGKLDGSEWEIMRRHTIEGEAMLRQVGGRIASIGRIVRASHERWDGTGYPDGLAGERIPIEARIVSACDAYSAMTTDRPYRPALGVRDALLELRLGAGSQFDPRVVRALERTIEAELAAAKKQLREDAEDPFCVIDSERSVPDTGAILTASPRL